MEKVLPDLSILEQNYIIYRFDKSGFRHYARIFENGETIVAPSFTTLMKEAPTPFGLKQWYKNLDKDQIDFEMVNSANYGTWYHVACSQIIRGEFLIEDKPIITNDDLEKHLGLFCLSQDYDFYELKKWIKIKKRNLKKDLMSFIIFYQEFKIKPIAVEFPIIHPNGLVATVIDMVCEMEYKGKKINAVIDFKSGENFYLNSELQLHINKWLFEIEWKIKIDKVFNFAPNISRLDTLKKYLEKGKHGVYKPYKFKDQTDSKETWRIRKYLSLYHGNPDNLKGVGQSIEFKDIEISIDLNTKESIEIINELENLNDKELF